MAIMNIIQAVNDALRLEMRRDPGVVVLGEDVGRFGGVFRASQGLQEEFGKERVIDTPLAESAVIGTALGMALYGLKPVPEIQFADFIFPAMDQILNEVAKFRYRSGGQFTCPMVIRTPYGGGIRGGHYHSQSPEAHFIHTAGLQQEFGEERVIDTPLAEGGIIGTAVGMALYGLRPVPEIQFADFIFPAFDQIVNEVAKYRHRSGGQYPCPLTIRTPYGGGIKGGHYHSQSPEALFLHTPGLKVVVPSGPYDAKGLLLSAIRDPDPVIFFEPKRVYRAAKGEVPEGEYLIPLGQAAVTRPGTQVTLIAWGAMWHEADQAAREAEAEGIDVEVLDLRSLQPLDIETITTSVKKTGRAVVVHEAPRTCGFGAELSALIQERCFLSLEAPVARVTGFDTPFPYTLEMEYLPRAPRILRALRETIRY
jgi:2-oxoisovalerate dehydrogenase E1 component beta subunit